MPSVLTRRAMYDLVWSKPMSKVAQDFGISDVALKKICQKHRVPSPPRGYWAKKEAGKPVKEVRFIETADPLEEKITIYGSTLADLPEPVREVLAQARAKRIARKQTPLPEVPVSEISAEHRAIALTAKKLRAHKPNKDGIVSAVGSGCCGIEISAGSVERCIKILDGLARSLEANQTELIPTGNCMAVTANEERVEFRLTEFIRRDKHIPTEEELAAEERRRKRLGITWDSPYGRAYPDWDFVRTGDLILEIENRYVDGLRRRWKDGKHQRLENLADEIAAGIKAYAIALKLQHEKHQRRQRNWDRRARVCARARARQEREVARRELLDELVAISTEATKLRTWLEEAKRWPARVRPDEFTRFVEWARDRLKYLEHAVAPDGIAATLNERELFPEVDPLIDPAEDLVDE